MASIGQATHLPAPRIGEQINEMFWNNASRAKALCTKGTLVGIVGGMLAIVGAQALCKDQQKLNMRSTSGALLTSAVGLGMVKQGLLMGVRSTRNANRIILEKKRIADFNRDMTQTAGAKNPVTILIAIDSNDHNGALAIENFAAQVGPWAENYSIHAVLVESPSDWDHACNQLEGQGKIVKHIVFAAHGDVDRTELGGKNIREYLAAEKRHPILKGEKLERCLIWSCLAGSPDGEAENIARENPNLEVWAPQSLAHTSLSFLDLDSSGPTILQFSKLSHSIITTVYMDTRRIEYPIESKRIQALCQRNETANKCVYNLEETLLQNCAKGCLSSQKILNALNGGIVDPKTLGWADTQPIPESSAAPSLPDVENAQPESHI